MDNSIFYLLQDDYTHTYIIFIYIHISYLYIYIHIYIYIIQLIIKLNFGAPNSAFLRPGAHGPVEPEAFGSAGPHRLLGAAPRARPGPRESARERGGLAEARRGAPGGDGRILGKSPSEVKGFFMRVLIFLVGEILYKWGE